MTRVEIEVEVAVNPTESVEKVERAVMNVLGGIDLKQTVHGEGSVLRAHLEGVESLRHLKVLFGRMRIRDAALAYLTRRIRGDVLNFELNKQAAYAGHASFYRPREALLGPIQIMIKGDVEGVVRYLCER